VAGVSPILAAVAALLDDAAAALTRTLRAELASERSELRAWLVERLDRAWLALIADSELRSEADAWAKARQRAGRAPPRAHRRLHRKRRARARPPTAPCG